ncbi:MAG: MobA/MobL family protein, partial [Candidatus Competibacter sp.]|nr:MobA/MobL family protein [Candidatus Competibacter sp.]
MATYHLSAKTISRSHGRSATAAAAYRTGARIADERTGTIHDYQRRRGVEAAVLVLPETAPDWASDRARLWNAAERAETRKNSTVAREFEIALPAELDAEQRQRLAVDFAHELVLRHGCAVDVAIHRPGRDGDSRNHHAHVLLTTRRLTAAGFTEKTRELDDLKTGEIGRWRARFADLQNERLREAGVEVRVDHRSLEAQAIDREATIHLGPTATALERRGVPTRRGESNRAVQASHAERQRDAEARPEADRRETEPTRPAEPQAAEGEAHAPAVENILQALREKTARLYRTAVLPPSEDEAFAEPPLARPPSPPETTEAERQRRADEAESTRRQREAERRALLRADIPALEREWSEWTRHQEWLARHEPSPAAWLADKWGELAQAKRAATAAGQALDALEMAYADWRKAHRLALLLPTYIPGSPRREVPAWEQRITEARITLEHAQAALTVAREAYDARLPAAEREARQMAEDQRRQLAALQGRIEERAGLIQRAKAAQEAERERLNAEARARAEAERLQRETEQRKIQEPER